MSASVREARRSAVVLAGTTLAGAVLAAAVPRGTLAQRPAAQPPARGARPARPDSARAARDTVARPPSGTATGIGGAGGDTTRARRGAPAAPRDSAARDTLGVDRTDPDSTSADSAGAARDSALIVWAEDDSTITALRARPGYDVVRYQGDTVRFRARERLLTLRGGPAAVERGQTLLAGSTVRYDDSLQVVTALADSTRPDSVVLRDPSQGSDVVVRGAIRYDLTERRGVVSGFSTSVAQGETWFVKGGRGAFATDSTAADEPGGGRTFYAHDGVVTSCNEEAPHYHFVARDVKMVARKILVIRPAVLYVGNVPVLWLPFVFQDTRPGRRSGLLRPTFGVAELLRNSPNYQRSIRNFGYYTTLGDYADVRGWVDYRSGARPGPFGFGSIGYNAETRYKWVDRFIDGGLALKHERLSNGARNTTVSWQHAQAFNTNRRFTANVNWAQNTTVQRLNQFDPYAVLGSINSSVNLQDKYGPVSLQLGGSAQQFPGRTQRNLDFPNFNLSTQTIAVTPWLDWTPTLAISNAQQFRLDQGVQSAALYRQRPDGTLDSTLVNSSTRNTTVRFDTPVKIFGFSWQNSFNFSENLRDSPTTLQFYRDPSDSTTRESRLFAQQFRSVFDWNTSFSLPSAFQGTWNVTPQVSIENVGEGGLLFRTQYSGGQWVRGVKRVRVGVSSAPTFYAFPRGFGPVERFRHSVNPVVSFSYAPRTDVTDAYLRATGNRRSSFLGAIQQNSISLGLTTNLEAKLRAPRTPAAAPDAEVTPLSGGSANAEGRKVKVLAVQFSGINYNVALSDSLTGRPFSSRGFTDQSFSYNLNSDLIPGFSLRQTYSLFLGNPQSDTAVFKPYRTETGLTFQLDRSSALFGAVTRLFGIRLPAPRANAASGTQNAPGAPPGGDPAFARQALAGRVAGSEATGADGFQTPQAWQLSLTYSSNRQRPDLRGNFISNDPTRLCPAAAFQNNPFGYDQCLAAARNNPTAGDSTLLTDLAGAPNVFTPAQRSLQASSSFHITQKWSTRWETVYDLVRGEFATNRLSLERELHDWRANFSYTQSPNGNSAFSFFIALKAQPELQFPYNRQTVRSPR